MTNVVLLGVLGAAAWMDWRKRKIPNTLVFPAIAVGLWYQWEGELLDGALLGVAGAFLLTVGPVILKGMGMGDQKLLMAVGAWTSWSVVYSLFLHSIVLCLIVMVFYPQNWARLRTNLQIIAAGWSAHRQVWLPGREKTALSFPYAVYLLGAFVFQSVRDVIEASG
ncbi:prepilin peptidase [Brevibacillus brevis]|uniref:Prepilin peptidase n=1 Tax=Brevibacillus brevis TaxID=1393 RepID=A0A517ID05_BREBE|nr:A24 family peptidase [Brevibacillus brevis]QDS36764.1 prepilin peptidase [Brevibacillus brevis]